jgi:CrcB protein
MERFLWICLAGAAGTGARYVIALWTAQRLGSTFPYGTLIVNLTGCFAIAAIMHAALTLSWSPTVRSAITIGFIGGLTTYSSFNYETTRLLAGSNHTQDSCRTSPPRIACAPRQSVLALTLRQGQATALDRAWCRRSSDNCFAH